MFETNPNKLMRDAAGFGWNFGELQAQKKLQVIFTTPQVLDQELRSADSLLMETAAEIGAKRIFIDGIGLLQGTLQSDRLTAPNGFGSFRESLQELIEGSTGRILRPAFQWKPGLPPSGA